MHIPPNDVHCSLMMNMSWGLFNAANQGGMQVLHTAKAVSCWVSELVIAATRQTFNWCLT
jgi:hypothetical protein